jgi:UPF0176 protein
MASRVWYNRTVSGYQVLLYYKYVTIEDPEELRLVQRKVCEELGLTGRIIVAHEGINGTVEGTAAQTERYVAALTADKRFADIHIKRSQGDGRAFPKLSVKVRSEIVSLHLGHNDINPQQTTGQYLRPEELHQWFEQGKEFYIIDMRNEYEQRVGHFAGSVLPKLGNFRDLPTALSDLAYLQNKTVLTVCTGGVRCEKASGFLVKHGFTDVYQLSGGIVSYMEKYPNQHFLGKLYVFDQRIIMGFHTNSTDHVVVGRCQKCQQACEQYVNCANELCHLHFICCADCTDASGMAYCSDVCRQTKEASQPAKSS